MCELVIARPDVPRHWRRPHGHAGKGACIGAPHAWVFRFDDVCCICIKLFLFKHVFTSNASKVLFCRETKSFESANHFTNA